VVKVEYVSKKIPADAEELVREFQAKYILFFKKRISEGQAVREALAFALKNFWKTMKRRKKYTLEDFIGVDASPVKSNAAKEVDEVVYGV